MKNNFIQKKQSQNAKLLSLLTNRERQKSNKVFKRNNDWPGLHNHNFTSTIRIQSGTVSQSSRKRLSLGHTSSKYLKLVPFVSNPDHEQNLILKPCKSNPIISINRYSSSSFRQKRPQIFQDNNLIKYKITNNTQQKKSQNSPHFKNVMNIQQNNSQSIIFSNSKISNQIIEVMNKKLDPTRPYNSLPRSKGTVTSKPAPQPPSQYKIDFYAFGFVEKVLDNPELWTKYVKKVPPPPPVFVSEPSAQ